MEEHGRGCSNIQAQRAVDPSSLFFVFEKRVLHFGYLSLQKSVENEKSVTAGRYAKSATQTVVLQY